MVVVKISEVPLALFVTKAYGTRQVFEKEKIVRTCLRMGASREVAKKVSSQKGFFR